MVSYLESGFVHVLPYGYDHGLFIISLFLSSKHFTEALWQALLFTVAHSLSLAAAVLGFIHFPVAWAECLIAASIFLVALESATQIKIGAGKWVLILVFGFLHGLGFATALQVDGLPQNDWLWALLGFNIGVELAQTTILLMCYALIAWPFGKHPNYKRHIVVPLSYIMAAIGLFWTVERFLAI